VEDPNGGKHPGYYNLPHDPERFPRERVLNHRINCTLSRGEIREGFLLAVGWRPPETYKDNQQIGVTVWILDQWDVELSAKVHLRMVRRPARQKEINRSKRGPLLSVRDKIPPKRSWIVPPDPPQPSLEEKQELTRRLNEAIARIRAKPEDVKVPLGIKSK
jgi:hypothetical protein